VLCCRPFGMIDSRTCKRTGLRSGRPRYQTPLLHQGPHVVPQHTEHAHTGIPPICHRQPRAVTSEPQAAGTIQLPGCTAWTPEAATHHASRYTYPTGH
jgi:hypothetical protein